MQGKAQGRLGRRLSIGASAWILAASILGAGPAAGTPITTCTIDQCTVFFSGTNGFGLDSGDATFVSGELGIPILQGVELFSTSGTLAETILFDPVLDLDPFPPSALGPNVATTEWTIRNITGSTDAGPDPDLIDNVFYLFVGFGKKDEFGNVPSFEDPSGNTINYGSTDLGLILDTADPWVILQAFDSGGNPFFYPAVDLGSIASGAEADPFDVKYFIAELQEPLPSIFVLPQFQVGAGFTVIPEPAAALLLCLGLAGLAVTRPRRS